LLGHPLRSRRLAHSTAGKTNIDFVGTERSVSCSDAVAANFDQDNEGHSCYIVSNIIKPGDEAEWLHRGLHVRFQRFGPLVRQPDAGHRDSFKVEVSVEGDVDPKVGWVYDHANISAAMKPLLKSLDHTYLNDIEGLENPTIEKMAEWFWKKLEPQCPGLCEIVVHETSTARCVTAANSLARTPETIRFTSQLLYHFSPTRSYNSIA